MQDNKEIIDYRNPRIVNKLTERMQAEVDTWMQLGYLCYKLLLVPNIVRFYDYAESVNNLYMFMEYCPGGTL